MKNDTALIRLGLLLTTLVGLSLSACATTTLAASWKSPTATRLAMKGEPVAAVIMIDDRERRRKAEDMLASEITHYGAKGIPMYRIAPEGKVEDEAGARAALEAAGVKGVVVMRPMGVKQILETHQYADHYSDPRFSSYWGGYHGYGWGNAWGAPVGVYGASVSVSSGAPPRQTQTSVTRILQVEILVYSLKQNQLVWAGQSDTTERPSDLQLFVVELAGLTAKELDRLGLFADGG